MHNNKDITFRSYDDEKFGSEIHRLLLGPTIMDHYPGEGREPINVDYTKPIYGMTFIEIRR
jgi:hypothetical protein